MNKKQEKKASQMERTWDVKDLLLEVIIFTSHQLYLGELWPVHAQALVSFDR